MSVRVCLTTVRARVRVCLSASVCVCIIVVGSQFVLPGSGSPPPPPSSSLFIRRRVCVISFLTFVEGKHPAPMHLSKLQNPPEDRFSRGFSLLLLQQPQPPQQQPSLSSSLSLLLHNLSLSVCIARPSAPDAAADIAVSSACLKRLPCLRSERGAHTHTALAHLRHMRVHTRIRTHTARTCTCTLCLLLSTSFTASVVPSL